MQFHYAFPEAVSWNRGAGVVLGFDETGFAGAGGGPHRRQAWNFLLEGGGGLFNNLDYSFYPGTRGWFDTGNRAPEAAAPNCGGNPGARGLSGSFDPAGPRTGHPPVPASPGVVSPSKLDPGHAHAMYLEGRAPPQSR